MQKYTMKKFKLWKLKLSDYLKRIVIAGSVLFNVLLGGHSNQTFSARQYELKRKKKINLVWLIDRIFRRDVEHCMMSWVYWNSYLKKQK